jgi:hypothetical protein
VVSIKAVSDNRRDSSKWSGTGWNRRHTDYQSEQDSREHREERGSAGSRQQNGSAESEVPLDLQAVIDARPTLPEAIKAGILAMVKAACH